MILVLTICVIISLIILVFIILNLCGVQYESELVDKDKNYKIPFDIFQSLDQEEKLLKK